MNRRIVLLLTCVMLCVGISACDYGQTTQKSTSGAEQVVSTYEVPKNSQGRTTEQQNIWDRQRVTTDPTKVMWVHLITPMEGEIFRRMPIRCKATSSGKRLEPVHAADTVGGYPDAVMGSSWETDELIQSDGTYGSSDNYIFWFDPMGRYHQLGTAGGLGYLITDYPIDLSDPINEITGLYNAHVAASKWQAEEEAKLRAQEAK